MNEAQIRKAIKDRVNVMIRDEGASFDPAKLDGIDVKTYMSDIASQWTFEEWDKVSPINRADAQTVIERYDIAPEDSVFLLKRNGQVVFFQPFQPETEGHVKMTPATVRTIAQDMLDKIVDQVIIEYVIPLLKV
jgi:hypothetical protein